MRKQHLSAFAVATRLFKSAGMGDPTSNVARLLIDATEKFAGYVRGAALALQRADVAIALASGVKAQVIVPDSAGSGEKLTSRTGVNVAGLVIGEVLAREDAVFALEMTRLADFVAKAGDFSCKWGGLICWNGPYHPPFEGVGITDWC